MSEKNDSPSLARIDLNLFRVFEVVYRERNLTRAAAVLHARQATIALASAAVTAFATLLHPHSRQP